MFPMKFHSHSPFISEIDNIILNILIQKFDSNLNIKLNGFLPLAESVIARKIRWRHAALPPNLIPPIVEIILGNAGVSISGRLSSLKDPELLLLSNVLEVPQPDVNVRVVDGVANSAVTDGLVTGPERDPEAQQTGTDPAPDRGRPTFLADSGTDNPFVAGVRGLVVQGPHHAIEVVQDDESATEDEDDLGDNAALAVAVGDLESCRGDDDRLDGRRRVGAVLPEQISHGLERGLWGQRRNVRRHRLPGWSRERSRRVEGRCEAGR